MISSTTQFDLNKAFPRKKIKTILTKPSRHVDPPEDLNMLLKKGIKIKNLQLTKTDRERKSFKISLIKKLTRCCKHLHGIEIDHPLTEDINNLLKIQSKIRGIQSLQFISIYLEGPDVCKRIKKLLVRFKYLKKYKNEPKWTERNQFVFQNIQSYLRNSKNGILLDNCNHDDRSGKAIPLASHTKKSILQSNSQKAQNLILGMRNRLHSLVSVEENQKLFRFAVNIDFNYNTVECDKKILGFIRRFKRKYPLYSITLSERERALEILPFVEANQLNIISQLNFPYVLKNVSSFAKFLSRKDAKIILDPSSKYSWEDVLLMLKFSQDIFFTYNSLIDFSDFTFDFHAPLEVRQVLLTRLKQKGMKWERMIFIFKAGSFDWLQENERSCLEDLINQLCKEENRNKYSDTISCGFRKCF